MIGITARMQDLHADAPALCVYRARDPTMARHFPAAAELGSEGRQRAPPVGRDATGDHEPYATAGPFGEIRRELGIIPGTVLETRMHGTHKHAVGQRHEHRDQEAQEDADSGAGSHPSDTRLFGPQTQKIGMNLVRESRLVGCGYTILDSARQFHDIRQQILSCFHHG